MHRNCVLSVIAIPRINKFVLDFIRHCVNNVPLSEENINVIAGDGPLFCVSSTSFIPVDVEKWLAKNTCATRAASRELYK